MKRALALSIAALFAVGACADSGTTDGPPDNGVEITLAALNLSDVTYTQYTITVEDASNNVVSTVQIDSDSYAVGDPSTVRYVAPCDSTDNDNEVIVSVDTIETSAGAVPAGSLPPDQSQTVTCNANESVQVSFDFQAITSSELGFFDVFIGTDVVYCSAKLDCDAASPLFPDSDATIVLGFSCTANNAATANSTVLHMDDIVIDCTVPSQEPAVTIDVGQSGNLSTGITDSNNWIDGVTVFRGEDLIGSTADNVYWNVAIGLDSNAYILSNVCSLKTHAAVTAGTSVPAGAPYIAWDVPITTASNTLTCDSHKLFAASSGVAVEWPSGTEAFDNLYYGNPTVFVTAGTHQPGATGSPRFASLEEADGLCQAAANNATPPLLGTYKAWLSDSSEDAATRLNLSPEALRLVDGTVAAASRHSLLAGSLTTAINQTENGGSPTTDVWTGTDNNGTVAAGAITATTCNDWADGTSGSTGVTGTQATDGTWTNDGTPDGCDQARHLICVQVQ